MEQHHVAQSPLRHLQDVEAREDSTDGTLWGCLLHLAYALSMYAMQTLIEQTWRQVSSGVSVCNIVCSFG